MLQAVRKTVYAGMTAALLLAVTDVAQAAYVVTRQGKRIEGKDIRVRSNGDVILTTDRGPLTFAKGTYVQAVADEPDSYKQAMRLAAGGKFSEAESLLKKIVSDYAGLQWDNRARVALAQVYAQQENYEEARRVYDELFREAPASKENQDLMWGYREVLLRSERYAVLEPELDELIAGSDRTDAARAQIMRGDIRKARNQMEPAVMDYMRTMVFFKDVPEYQPEAMYKAAEGLEAIRDDRARKVYEDLVAQYPDSPYARQAQSKL